MQKYSLILTLIKIEKIRKTDYQKTTSYIQIKCRKMAEIIFKVFKCVKR